MYFSVIFRKYFFSSAVVWKTRARHLAAQAKYGLFTSLLWLLLSSERSEQRRTRKRRGDLTRKGHVFLNRDTCRGCANADEMHEAARCVGSFVLCLNCRGKRKKNNNKKKNWQQKKANWTQESGWRHEIQFISWSNMSFKAQGLKIKERERISKTVPLATGTVKRSGLFRLWILQHFAQTQYQKCLYELSGSKIRSGKKSSRYNVASIPLKTLRWPRPVTPKLRREWGFTWLAVILFCELRRLCDLRRHLYFEGRSRDSSQGEITIHAGWTHGIIRDGQILVRAQEWILHI